MKIWIEKIGLSNIFSWRHRNAAVQTTIVGGRIIVDKRSTISTFARFVKYTGCFAATHRQTSVTPCQNADIRF